MSHSRLFSSNPNKASGDAADPVSSRRGVNGPDASLRISSRALLLRAARKMQPHRAFHMSAIGVLRCRSRVDRLCRYSSGYETKRLHRTLYCTNVSYRYRNVRRTIPTFAILSYSVLRRLTLIERSARADDPIGQIACSVRKSTVRELCRIRYRGPSSLCAWRNAGKGVGNCTSANHSAGYGETTRI